MRWKRWVCSLRDQEMMLLRMGSRRKFGKRDGRIGSQSEVLLRHLFRGNVPLAAGSWAEASECKQSRAQVG